MRKQQPKTLLNKCLNLVLQLVLKLIQHSTPVQDIQDIIACIPQTLANEFTSMIFTAFEGLPLPAADILQGCVHPSVKNLDMSSWRAGIQQQVCTVLPKLEYLRMLSLSIHTTRLWFSANLVSFSYPEYCTDNMIQDLSQFCKSLQVLSVPLADGITDDCICFLLQLQELRDLNVTATKLTDKGCVNLLFGLHKLSKWNGGYVLDHHFVEQSESMQDFTSYKLKGNVDLGLYFPNLTHIALSTLFEANDIIALSSLANLQHINVRYPHLYDDGMRNFMNVQGKNMLTLCVQEVLQMDFIHMATKCLNLKTLQLEDCFISVASMGSNSTLPHFHSVKRLEVIVFNEEWSSFGFQFPFFEYTNLHHLLAINVTEINDSSLTSSMIERDWLKKLRTLELRGTLGYLSTRTFILLLKHCPQLERVSDLASWRGMPHVDLQSIMNVAKQKNLDITILAYPDAAE